MSHTVEYYQRMDTAQLIHEMNHAFWDVDRKRARKVYEDRIREQEQKDRERSDRQSTDLNNHLNGLQNRINGLAHQNADLTRIIRQQNTDLQNMQTAHNQQVAAMRTDYNRRIKQVNDENRAAIHNLEVRMVNEDEKLRTAINDNFQRTTRMINDVNADLTQRINTIHQDLSSQLSAQQRRIDDLDNRFQALHHNDQQLRDNAMEYLEAAVELINSTIEYNNANLHSWRSDELQELISLRNHVHSDLNSGMLAVGTARAGARSLFEQALRYRANVYADEREWQLRHATAQQCIDAAYNDLVISRTIDADGMEIDVDYWTCGDLRRIENHLHELEMLIENPNLTHDELSGIGELAEMYRQEISVAVAFAMQAVQCSRDRKELLEIAVEHIENTMGILHPEWQEYFAGDSRLGYRVYLTSPQTGERVVLTAEPSADQTDIRNQFRFEILSTGTSVHNAQAATAFTNSLAQALSEIDGCVFTSPTCTNQAAPAADNGQGNRFVWSSPDGSTQTAAMEHATPEHAPLAHQPVPQPASAFRPQPQI